jgi:tetratricopeptide (TPR) repeat protein
VRHGERVGQRLRREAQVLAHLRHPSIVDVYDVGEIDGELFFAMELVRGVTLEQRLSTGAQSWRDALAVLLPAAAGLAAAHAAGVVHRDFKPANVMLAEDGRVLVMDFGVARAVAEPSWGRTGDHGSLDPTRTGELLGTPLYMAPEQLAGEPATEASDQFAFCVVLFEALHGRRPWHASSVTGLLECIRERGHLALPRVAPRWLERAMRRGLDFHPHARHASMAALVDALQRGAGRRVWPLIAGTAALASLGAVGLAAGEPPSSVCHALEPRMATVWDDAARSQASDAFRVELDDYVQRWEAARDGACVSDDPVRIACLRRSRTATAALLDGLADADAAATAHAVDAVDRLPSLDECDAREHEPAPEIALQVEALRDRIARATALSDLGRYDAVADALRGVVEEARALAHDPLLAEALLASVAAIADAGDEAGAVAAAEEAYWVADRCDHDRLAADAAIEVVSRSLPSHDIDRVRVWLRHAKARTDRGASGRLAKIRVLTLEAGVADLEGRTEDALRIAEQACAAVEAEHDVPMRVAIDAAVHVGRIQRQLARFDDALATYARLRERVHASVGAEHPYAAMIANNVGTVLADLGRLDDAAPEFERALRIRESVLGPHHVSVANALNNVAGVRMEQGRIADAVPLFERALSIWREKLGPDHIVVSNGARNLAQALDRIGRHEDALAAREEALAVSNETFDRDDPRLAIDVCARASTLAHLGRVAEAHAELDRCVPILERGFPEGHPERDAALARAREVRLVHSEP